jgi:hypothetical protein
MRKNQNSKLFPLVSSQRNRGDKRTGGRKKRRMGEKEKTGGIIEDRKKKTKEEETKKNKEKPEGAHVQPAECHAFINISFVLSRGKNRGD